MEYVHKRGLAVIIGVAFIAAVIGMFDASSSTRPQVASLTPPTPTLTRIGFIGDSITDGPGSSGKSAVEVEVAALGDNYEAINRGKDSSTTSDWLPGRSLYEGSLAEFKKRHVGTVSIMLGTNDARESSFTPPEVYKKNLEAITKSLLSSGTITRVIINYPPYVVPGSAGHKNVRSQQLLKSYIAKINDVTKMPGVSLGDVKAYDYFKRHKDKLVDGIHPTDEGYAELGELWADAHTRILAKAQ